ncbi:MAG: GH25 family lysozyme [Microcoleaceae cyanobacterium]
MAYQGIDVSDWQPNVNWKAVADAGMTFAIIKATEGATFVADVFPSYWEQIKAQGLVRGAYHFFRPGSSVQGQIDNFLNTVSLEDGDLPPVCDIETTDGVSAGTLLDRMGQWLEAVEQRTGYRPIVYTYPGFWESLNTSRFSDYPLWIAHYTSAAQPIVPRGWDSWMLWQFTDSGSVPGVGGGTDVNVFEDVVIGTSGEKVKKFQGLLKQRGFDPGPVDGIFGNGTKSAVVELQKLKGIPQDGVGDLKTWAALLGNLAAAEVPPAPESPVDVNALLRKYKGTTSQKDALTWLEQQASQATLLEFSRLWRGQNTLPALPVNLINVGQYYLGLPNQVKAIAWLEQQLPSNVLIEFENKWNAPPAKPEAISLVNVAKYYQGLPKQDAALKWLESQLSPETLEEFTRLWR